MRCPNCQAENRPTRRFCAECGEPLDVECIKCGFANKPDETFCGGCGANLGATTGSAVERYDSPRSYTPTHLAEAPVVWSTKIAPMAVSGPVSALTSTGCQLPVVGFFWTALVKKATPSIVYPIK